MKNKTTVLVMALAASYAAFAAKTNGTLAFLGNYGEDSLARKESLYDWCKALGEDKVWIPDNLSYLRGKYTAAIAENRSDYESRVNRALTALLLLGENEDIRDVVRRFGFTLPDFYIYEPQGEFCGLENAPSSTNVADTVLAQALLALDDAIADIESIPENWSGNLELNPSDYPALSESVFLDRAEVAAVRATLRAMRGAVLLAQGYDFESDYLAVSNAWTQCAKVQNVLDAMPRAGLVRDVGKLAVAKEDFRASLLCMKKVDAAILARTDGLTHFLEYDTADERDIAEARSLLDQAIASLDETVEVDLSYAATQSPLNASPLAPDALPNGFVRQVYLGALFAGNVTRELLPSFEYGVKIDRDPQDGDFLPLYFDTIPDSTFGGLAPDLTVDEVVNTYTGDKWWTAKGYIRDNPKLKISEGRVLTVSGAVETSAPLSFTVNTGGWLDVYEEVDGILYSIDSDMVDAGEMCEYEIVEGTSYRIEFYPSESITVAVSPITLHSIPEPYADGGPYKENVDGVEWTFMVEDGKAVLGSEDLRALSDGTSGAIEIPLSLGGRPVVAIGDGAFSWLSSLKSITIPATVAIIGEEAFNSCTSLESLVFLGNEPLQVGEDAFKRVKEGLAVHATRASNWNVPIPGTWNGFPIDYVAGYNPAVTVSANLSDGFRFEEPQVVEFSCGQGQTVYYTVDGSSPLDSPTRIRYDGVFDIDETTTVTYCAIDDATGDWSEICVATYSLIVRLPDGGPYSETVNGLAWNFNVVNGESVLMGIDVMAMSEDDPYWVPSGRIEIPSVLGEHPVVRVENCYSGPADSVKRIVIPDSVTSIAMAASFGWSSGGMMFPAYYDETSWPGFLAIDGWILSPVLLDYPRKIDLGLARGIADGLAVAGPNTREVILPNSLTRITTSMGLYMYPEVLRSIKIPDSVTSVEAGALPLMSLTPSALFDTESFPGFAAIDGWIVCRHFNPTTGFQVDLPAYCDLSHARGMVDGVVLEGQNHYSTETETLILPGRGVVDIGMPVNNPVPGISISRFYSLKDLFIPNGVTNIGMGAIIDCPKLKELYLPQSVKSLGDYSWTAGLETLYVHDSLRGLLETYDETICVRPIELLRDANPGNPVEVVYYSTEQYQHTMRFNANGGAVSETVRKVSRGSLPGILPTPSRPGFAFVRWTLDESGKKAFDASRVVLGDATLYAQWESVYGAVLASDGRLVLSEMSESPAGAVALPHIVDGFGPIEVIGRDLMRGASEVTSVTLPPTVTEIGPSAFRECSRMESIELPDGLLEIGDNAFRECVSLRSVTIPASVRHIGYFAFRDCLRLETVNLLGDPPCRDLGVFMGVPAFTTVSGRLGSSTAIVYAVVTNSTPEITVPDGWLDEIAVAHDKPAGAESYQAAFVEKFGSDLGAALVKPTGKYDLKGNPMYVWQDYVAGTDPLDEEDKFTATIAMEDGMPVVRWSPELPVGKAVLRKYTTYGATALGGDWVDVSDMSDAERHAAGYQFFQVSVELKR